MLKRLILSVCLMFAVFAVSAAVTGCHASATTDKGHGAAVDVG